MTPRTDQRPDMGGGTALRLMRRQIRLLLERGKLGSEHLDKQLRRVFRPGRGRFGGPND